MPSTFKNLTVNDTGYIQIPLGTSSNRTANTTTSASFTSVGTTSWTCPSNVTSVEVLVVAGGGGAGRWGGGGGAGGLIYNSRYPVTPGTSYTVTVGAGGAGKVGDAQAGGNAASGSNSVFGTLTAIGGGGGGNYGQSGPPGAGLSGGSGGGGGASGPAYDGRANAGGVGTAGQGNSGGIGGGYTASYGTNTGNGGGGGGGAGGAGRNSAYTYPVGGAGLTYAISGSPVAYAGGGAGIVQDNSALIPGGIGGGGTGGGGGGATVNAADGVANTGGGGGALQDGYVGATQRSGNGGSGIVVLRYSLASDNTDPLGQTRLSSDFNNTSESFTANAWYTNPTYEGETNFVKDTLICHLDASKYPGSGSTWYDISGNGNHFTLYNSPTNSNGAFTFNGTSQYAASTNNINLSTYSSVTVEVVFQLNAWDTQGMLYEHTTDWNTQSGGFGIYTNNTGSIFNDKLFHSNHNNGAATGARAYEKSFGTRYNVVTSVYSKVADDTGRLAFVNGLPVATSSANGSPTNSVSPTGASALANAKMYLAARAGTGSFIAGKIAAVRIYGRKLNPAEIRLNYNGIAGRYNLPQVSMLGSSAEYAAANPAALRAAGITQSGTYWLCPPGGSGVPFKAWCIMGRDGDWVKVIQFYNSVSMTNTKGVNINDTWSTQEINLAAGRISLLDWQALNTSNEVLFRVTGGSDNLLRNGAGTGKLRYFGDLPPYGTDLDPTAGYQLSLDLYSKGVYDYTCTYGNDGQARCNHTTNYWIGDHNYNGSFANGSTAAPPANTVPICWTVGPSSVITNLHWMSGLSAQSSGSISWGNSTSSAWAFYVK